MKQTAKIISTYSADTFGVCSALFELGGMVIMHDASGCNSTYTTHDEPRWYDMDSMIYISALTEIQAVMGDDEKLFGDIINAAQENHPNFIAIAGTPIPAMTGFDFSSAARVIEKRTGIPSFGFATTGMSSYVSGASSALKEIAERFCDKNIKKANNNSVNILGLTPIDFSVSGEDKTTAKILENSGFKVNVSYSMNCCFNDLARLSYADINLVVSASGYETALYLNREFGIPYVVGTFCVGNEKQLLAALKNAMKTGKSTDCIESTRKDSDIIILGEGVRSVSLANSLEALTSHGAKAICTVDCDKKLLRSKDIQAVDEDEIIPLLQGAEFIIADPLYKPIIPSNARFVSLPHEGFSGRMFRKEIPDSAADIDYILKEVSL